MPALNDRVRHEVEQLLAARRKIDAIKRLRDATGLGLADAKAAVEDWRAWSARHADTPGASAAPAVPTAPGEPNWSQIDALVAGGKKLQAIKLYRENTGAGLKEAVDALKARLATPTAQVWAEVDAMLDGGRRIDAIKRYREITGVRLQEATEAIEVRSGVRTVRTPLGETGRNRHRTDTPPTAPATQPPPAQSERAAGPAAFHGDRPDTVRAVSTKAQESAIRERSADRGQSSTYHGAERQASPPRQGAADAARGLDNQHLRDIERQLFAGKKRHAIAALREVTGMGLYDAKQEIDRIEADLREQNPQLFESRRGFGCGTAVLLIGLGISTAGGFAIWLAV